MKLNKFKEGYEYPTQGFEMWSLDSSQSYSLFIREKRGKKKRKPTNYMW